MLKLSRQICLQNGWLLKQARFYTGFPFPQADPFWSGFWLRKLLAISRQGVVKFSRPLRNREKTVTLPDGREHRWIVGEEKRIDVRIAVDMIRLALDSQYDVAVVFSQDQDLSEATDEVKKIAAKQDRWMRVASAFPIGPGTRNAGGIDRTDWIKLDAAAYSPCIDPVDYRPARR